jgi:epsin
MPSNSLSKPRKHSKRSGFDSNNNYKLSSSSNPCLRNQPDSGTSHGFMLTGSPLNSILRYCSSNNPFAPIASPVSASSGTPVNGISGPSFNLQGTYTNATAPSYNSSPAPSQAPASTPSPSIGASTGSGTGRPTRADQEHSHLADLFANRDDGQDTFGNIGLLRYGQTPAGQLAAQKTGFEAQNNPFQKQQQQQGQGAEQPFFSL